MSKEKHRLGQDRYKLLINLACHGKGAKSAICGDHAVELPFLAFLDEFSAVGGARGYEVGDVAEAFPCLAGAVCMSECIGSIVERYELMYWSILPRRRTLGRAISLFESLGSGQ